MTDDEQLKFDVLKTGFDTSIKNAQDDTPEIPNKYPRLYLLAFK
ncbi:hypothetical protein CNO14_07270 (plasmid) [Borrelia miyamotoi]|nr:hypothetical protein [Borrelia miyamotoi]WCB91066.1 hypothetical protein CNO11_07430 [Borrelia miyamotoi]WCL22197.1 hypothetical protein CNO10_07440 [Borrelia miyamotoi]WDE73211.1 hypothetical protein CNO14_07270 [Borrelia miyamotoi]WDS47351.1 hypothetical protein EZU72_007730 [Borrelia miyamotoi]WDS49184.1 hypothetical protein EZU71_008050 [Borrelia miyamotoi]